MALSATAARPAPRPSARARRRRGPIATVDPTKTNGNGNGERRGNASAAFAGNGNGDVLVHRSESRASLEARNRSLLEANEALEAFSYVVSHDLKEPVRAVEFYLRVIDEDHGEELPPEVRELVRRGRDANRRLQSLVDGLLDVSRAARIDAADLHAVRVEDAIACDFCMLRFQRLYEERHAELNVAPGIPPVVGSLDILCQILGNLLVNAVKHNPRSAPKVRVSGRPFREDPSLVELVVEDNGPGFDPAVGERLWERMRPNALPATFRNGGFGLTIAARAVERLGGTMWLRNSPEGGAAVHLTLPASESLVAYAERAGPAG